MSTDDGGARTRELIDRTVRSMFDAIPAQGRVSGDHSYDGVLGDTGPAWPARRAEELDSLAAELAVASTSPGDAALRADLATARIAVADELFHLRVLRAPSSDPQWALWRGCDVSTYVTRAYAPAHDRADAATRHLEALPDWLDAAAGLLDAELATVPRDIAVESVRGHAAFYRDEVRAELGDLGDPVLQARLDRAIELGAAACERHAERLEAAGARDDWALGPDRFVAMLHAQEGVEETMASLRDRVDAELEALTDRGRELAGRTGAPSLGAALASLEATHPPRDGLLTAAQEMVDRLRDFWASRDVLTLPEGVECTVRRSPSFYSFITAAFDNPGFLESVPLPHFYWITTVDPAWSDEQADGWLRHLNNASLENISVHEVFPGHFVQVANSIRTAGTIRNVIWCSGFGEGWAHYTELLAVEQGLADGRPELELAMVQDALLRVVRFRTTVGVHAEGIPLDEGIRLFEERAHIPRIAAEREARRATWDPMYLAYTYGKLEILRWRDELSRRPGFSLKRFHDRLLGGGAPPLAVMRDYLLADGRA
ncbi:MAG TPA: DUF885 domain-containing protein [Candidatus Dormibacteraeota bacterium]|nr:DUF885 domain-containing protein [Candidatus Dormibacteraeota bacterium]